jgi:hypothetical protein
MTKRIMKVVCADVQENLFRVFQRLIPTSLATVLHVEICESGYSAGSVYELQPFQLATRSGVKKANP